MVDASDSPYSNPLPYLNEACLEALQIDAHEVVNAIETIVQGQAEGTVWNAPKASITPPDDRFMMSTMCAADGPGLLAVKSLVLNPGNPADGLPMMNSLVSLVDSRTGVPRAIVDGNWVTSVRTAGLSALAARYLAAPDSKVIAFIGCGVQARAHLEAFAQLYPLAEVRAFGRGAHNRDALCALAEELKLKSVTPESAQQAIAGAHIVVTSVTRSPSLVPFLDANWLSTGSFVTVTDVAAPWHDGSLETLDNVIIDDLKQEAIMSKPMVDTRLVAGDLTGLVYGKVPGRRAPSERTGFVFRGLGLGDLAVAALAYEHWLNAQ